MAKARFTGVKTVAGQQKSHLREERANSSTEKREGRFKKSSKQHCMSNRRGCLSQVPNKKSDIFSLIGWRMYINKVFVREPMSDMRRLYGCIWNQALDIINFKSLHRNIFSCFTKIN